MWLIYIYIYALYNSFHFYYSETNNLVTLSQSRTPATSKNESYNIKNEKQSDDDRSYYILVMFIIHSFDGHLQNYIYIGFSITYDILTHDCHLKLILQITRVCMVTWCYSCGTFGAAECLFFCQRKKTQQFLW